MKNSNHQEKELHVQLLQAFVWKIARVDLPKLTVDMTGTYHLQSKKLDRKPLGGN